jgi:hypothetical protein
LYAQVATANKIARTVYHLLKFHVQYEAMGADEFERRYRQRDLNALRKKAAKLGFTLVESQPGQAAAWLASSKLSVSHRLESRTWCDVSQKFHNELGVSQLHWGERLAE